MVAHVLFWIGIVCGCIDVIGVELCVHTNAKLDATKLAAGFGVTAFFLLAAVVAKYVGY